jgi:hypothetical protein
LTRCLYYAFQLDPGYLRRVHGPASEGAKAAVGVEIDALRWYIFQRFLKAIQYGSGCFCLLRARVYYTQALAELGKAVKTIFLCRYPRSEALRREIHEGLNVIENWNYGAKRNPNGFIFYGRSGECSTNSREEQELSALGLHLVQNCLVYVNTLMIQNVLGEPGWLERMKPEDLRALTPLIYSHINPYGTFHLNMQERLPLEGAAR